MRNLLVYAVLVFAGTQSALGAARAAPLQHLHVLALTLTADTRVPRVDQPYHLQVFVHVRERVANIDNLVLPNLSELEITGGDQKRTAQSTGGTNYTESIGVIARHAGPILIAPAYVDAIDARDGKAKRFLSNDLQLQIASAAVPMPNVAGAITNTLARTFAWMVGITLAVAVVALVFLRPRPAAILQPTLPVTPVAGSGPRDRLNRAAANLRAEPTRASALDLRNAAWNLIGASPGETLLDALERPDAQETNLRRILVAAERAAFTYDADLTAAIGDLIAALDRYPA